MTAGLGHWVLKPEPSPYDLGAPANLREYLISETGGKTRFEGRRNADGNDMAVEFAAAVDGDVTVSQAVLQAVRRVSADGALMTVLQGNADDHGGFAAIFQVYRQHG